MKDRLSLHNELIEVLGANNVYFQAPPNNKLKYPCIIYKRKRPTVLSADNKKYVTFQAYAVTAVYIDPDDDLSRRILEHFDFCSPDTDTYLNEGLYHDVFTLYY